MSDYDKWCEIIARTPSPAASEAPAVPPGLRRALTDIDLRELIRAYERQNNPTPLFWDAVLACLRELQERRAAHEPALEQTACARCDGSPLVDHSPGCPLSESPKPVNHDLWLHLHEEHGLTLLQSELDEILRLAQPPSPVHFDDIAVDRFAAAMKAKLAKKRGEGRGGWEDPDQCTIGYLQRLLAEHVEKGDMVDIGNFAMMLFNRFKSWDDEAASRPTKISEPVSFGLEIDGDPQFYKTCPKCRRDYIGGKNDACPRLDCKHQPHCSMILGASKCDCGYSSAGEHLE